MYNLSKSSKKVSDLSVGDSIVVYAKGLPYQTKMRIDEYDTGLEYVFYMTDTIRQWVYRDWNGLYKTIEQLIDEFHSLTTFQRLNAAKKAWPSTLQYSGTCIQSGYIIEWLRFNISKTRAFKQRQLYISGPKMCTRLHW